MAKKPLPPPEQLRQLLRYVPDTGKLYWLEREVGMFKSDGANGAEKAAAIWNARYAGREALATATADGYRTGALFGVQARAHRVAWAIVYGRWPSEEIDHINGDRSDNRLVNLREVDRRDNARNTSAHSRNTSGRVGVYFRKRERKWMAGIGIDGRFAHLGYFNTYDEAVRARERAEADQGYHANHGR